ncbi:ABC transporter permease [Leucobacter denitrificans]|uniref:Iron ABC transporter permease n=1 Tax=Leucobacter denitrificans TaxID=683042 RepID=A0A7G9S3E6_9MICO|nr:iron ABC transporter permease [Leucobacter denitrificans]QNN62371.1 iron ABC transporter permease [Leucobacter denitrificans]
MTAPRTPRLTQPKGGKPSGSTLRIALIATILFVLVVWPLIMLAYGSFRTASPLSPGEWSFGAYERLWGYMNDENALRNSLIVALIATPLSGILGVGIALIVERTDAPFRRMMTPVMVIIAIMQGIIYVVGWSLLGNTYTGVLNVAYRALTGSDGHIMNIESWPGLVLVQGLPSAAIVYLLVLGPIRALDRSQEEASLTSGASWLRTTFLVTLPLLAPILTGVMMIGFLAEIMSLPTGLVIGAPAGIMLLPVKVFENLNNGNPPPYADAAAVSLTLVVATLVLMLIQAKLLGKRSFTTVSGKPSRGDVWRLGRWRWLMGAILGAYIVFMLVLPLGSIVLASFQPFPGVLTGLSFNNYKSVLNSTGIVQIVWNTLFIAVVVGFIAVFLAFLVAYISIRSNPRAGVILRGMTVLPIAMPGIIGPIAVLWGFVSVPGLRMLFGTIWLVMLALIVRVLPIAVQLGSAAIRQVSQDLEDAARISGRTSFQAAIGITGRLLLPSFFVGWFMSGLLVVNNLEVPLLLGSAQSQTVASRIYGLYMGAVPSQGAALLVLTVIGVAVIGSVGFIITKILASLLERFANARSEAFLQETEQFKNSIALPTDAAGIEEDPATTRGVQTMTRSK